MNQFCIGTGIHTLLYSDNMGVIATAMNPDGDKTA